MVFDSALALNPSQFKLLDAWQRDFPLASHPYGLLADAVQMTENDVIEFFQDQLRQGTISRIGPVINQAIFGASALVALSVPPAQLEDAAACVNAHPEVNHNYEREHAFNLWFVALCRTVTDLNRVLTQIHDKTGCHPIALPMEKPYHIDLGFSLRRSHANTAPSLASHPSRTLVDFTPSEDKLLRAVQHGIDAVARPWQTLGEQTGLSEKAVLATIQEWLQSGILKRFGVVLRHRRLGYTANAMCVWDVDNSDVDALGAQLAQEPAVTLCYRRSRHLPQWPYNLFCMIHGQARDTVLRQRIDIATRLGLDTRPHAILFSRRSFKQQGAWLGPRATHHEHESA